MPMHNFIEQRPFHLAISVHDLKIARNFYSKKLGFKEGRSSDSWIDFNFFGHQLVCHIGDSVTASNEVDGKDVPIPHFGIVLEWNQFDIFANNLKKQAIKIHNRTVP